MPAAIFISERIVPLLAFLNLALIILLLALCRREIAASFKALSRKYWLLLIAVFVIALLLRVFLAPPAHRNLIDEPFYIAAAKNIAQGFRAALGETPYPKQIGWPLILTPVYLFSAATNYGAIYLSVFIGSLSVLLMFCLVYLLSHQERMALISAFLLAILPVHQLYSATAESAAASVLFLLAAAASFCLLIEKPGLKMAMLTALLFSFAIQTRVENAFLALPFGVHACVSRNQPALRRFGAAIALCAPFIASYIFQLVMLLLFYDDAYGHRITFFGAGNLAAKAGSALFPGLVTALLAILAAAGFLLSWQKRGSMLPFFGSWFCISFACYLLYNYAVDFHALAALVALMPLAAFAIWHFSLQLPALNVAIPALLLALSALSPAAASPEMLLETQLMSTIAAELPQGCRLIMEVPTIVSPVPGMSTMEFLNIHSNAPELPKGRCFLYFEDAYCVKDLLPNSAKRCGLMRSHFRMAKLKEYYGEGIIFGLYEVEQPYRNSMKNASVLLPP